ncbi:MAG: tetratricopeptide repeat protein, partial [Nitrososphaeraceae archaeon]
INQSPNDVRWYYKGLLLDELGRYKEALECYENAISLRSNKLIYPKALRNKQRMINMSTMYRNTDSY